MSLRIWEIWFIMSHRIPESQKVKAKTIIYIQSLHKRLTCISMEICSKYTVKMKTINIYIISIFINITNIKTS